MIVARRMGLISKSAKRDRRPSVEEMDKLMNHFADRHLRGRSLPMHHVCALALFSTRRQEEIMRISWDDLEADHSRVLVRDMKHPGDKVGNDIWCELTRDALSIALAQPRVASERRLFPFSTTRSRPALPGPASCSASKTCTSTICVMRGCRDYSRWAELFHKPQAYQATAADKACSDTVTCARPETNGGTGLGFLALRWPHIPCRATRPAPPQQPSTLPPGDRPTARPPYSAECQDCFAVLLDHQGRALSKYSTPALPPSIAINGKAQPSRRPAAQTH